MTNEAWKRWEREVAEKLGGTRTGPRGLALPDVSGIPLGVEAKCYQTLSLREADMQQAETNAKKLGLPWALAIRKKGRGGRKLVVVPLDLFVEMYQKWNQI